jgi:hypothetical protein
VFGLPRDGRSFFFQNSGSEHILFKIRGQSSLFFNVQSATILQVSRCGIATDMGDPARPMSKIATKIMRQKVL